MSVGQQPGKPGWLVTVVNLTSGTARWLVPAERRGRRTDGAFFFHWSLVYDDYSHQNAVTYLQYKHTYTALPVLLLAFVQHFML